MLVSFLLMVSIYTTPAAPECSSEDYHPPQQAMQFNNIEYEEFILFDQDPESGCFCKQLVNKKRIKCFGSKSCQTIPQNLPSSTTEIIMSSTNISRINRGEFDKYRNITSLKWEESPVFYYIEPGSLLHLSNLTKLYILFNENLKALESDTFLGLVGLEELYMWSNGFNNLYDITISLGSKILPNLRLTFLTNTFKEIQNDVFEPMNGSLLNELNLIDCMIEYIHEDALKPLKHLEILRLGNSNINISTLSKALNKSIEYGVPLQKINLYGNGYKFKPPYEILETVASSNISEIHLSGSEFPYLSNESFPYMPSLVSLDMSEAKIWDIRENTFSNLPGLRTLVLHNNNLVTIPMGLEELPCLTYLDVRKNQEIKPFSLSRNNESPFRKMKNLRYLDLSFNNLGKLKRSDFLGLEKLTTLGLQNSSIFYIENDTFTVIPNLEFLQLQNNYFKQNHVYKKGLFRSLNNLKILLLSECSVKDIPYLNLSSLIHLDLEKNQLLKLENKDFENLPNLETLNLEGNVIPSWINRVFLNNTNLKEIILSGNKLTHLTEAMLLDFMNVSVINIADNPFLCDCTAYGHFQKWFEKNPKDNILEKIKRFKTYCTFPNKYTNITFDSYIQSIINGTIICENSSNELILIIPISIMLGFFLLLVIVFYWFRHHIRYWIFLSRLYLTRKGKIKPKTNVSGKTKYDYDAFVSYSTDDRNFVLRLVSMLENYEPYLKLCVYERDFEIGTIISESVLESVARSRRTLLIISDSYAKSQWCRWESQIADHHRLFFEGENGEYVDDSLVLIKLGPVSSNHMTPTLKYLLKTRIYLAWDVNTEKQKVFWNRLRNTLAYNRSEISENTHM